ncbi:MAG: nickel-dependent hydrogenase large subunit [Desulfobacterales bacterium]|nr:nickel-dependent hydrogenase large subunit [Desulfobacterales bacterium]MCP4160966.1 nickel-dependent hydrogenase large subunit [Deltaproteobacteria bacterium]
MGKRITIDPITRIEGHLRIDVEVENGKVKNAWSSGQMFRGIENMLTGRDPRDAQHFVQRSCGVCTYIHALSSVRAVEDALNLTIPENARLIRNLLHGAQYQQDHIVHFYHLHALDWVDIVSALSADPKATAKLSANASGRPESADYFKKVKGILQNFVNSGQLGPFSNGYWGHPAMKLPPEANLMAAAHYLEALQLQAKAATMHAILGGKNPHPQSLVVGGVTLSSDLTVKNLKKFESIWKETKKFIDEIYIPDLLAVASFYKDWGAIGGNKNFLAYGEFPLNDSESKLFLPSGYLKGDLRYRKFDDKKVTEDVSHGWYEKGSAKHPYKGETKPLAEDIKHSDSHYSWSKAPRYNGAPMEVGPLARVLVAYAKGDPAVKKLVGATLKKLNVGAGALFSTLGRTAARGLETVLIGNEMGGWLNQLKSNISKGKTKTYQEWSFPKGEIKGRGLNDVPRGGLGHWVVIKGGKIKNYQYVVPTTWNMSPRDAKGQMGPYENALIGTPIADAKRPLEVLRTIHSFDPCIACAVHVIDPHTNETYKVKVL